MKLVRVRRAIAVNEGLGRNADGVDDERIATLVVPDRFSIPGGFDVFRMAHVQIDVAYLRAALADHHNLVWSLVDEVRLDQRNNVEIGHAILPSAFARADSTLSLRDFIIRLLHFLIFPGL